MSDDGWFKYWRAGEAEARRWVRDWAAQRWLGTLAQLDCPLCGCLFLAREDYAAADMFMDHLNRYHS